MGEAAGELVAKGLGEQVEKLLFAPKAANTCMLETPPKGATTLAATDLA